MKQIFRKQIVFSPLLILTCIACMTACKPEPIATSYVYESNPVFSWGYAEFYGDYYNHGNYKISNNVITLKLFTDGLFARNDSLKGTGQYLIVEDIFLARGDTLLRPGTYRASETHEPFTFLAGKLFEHNRHTIPSGAYIYYIEPDPLKSKTAYITDGTMTIDIKNDSIYTIQCDFVIDKKNKLQGKFQNVLSHLNKSVAMPATGSTRSLQIRSQPFSNFVRR